MGMGITTTSSYYDKQGALYHYSSPYGLASDNPSTLHETCLETTASILQIPCGKGVICYTSLRIYSLYTLIYYNVRVFTDSGSQ
jgi:hypothetical protein